MRVENLGTQVFLTPAEMEAFTTVRDVIEKFANDENFFEWVEDVTRGDTPDLLIEDLSGIISNAKIDTDRRNY